MPTGEMPRDDLIKWIRQLESRLAIVEQRSPLANTGMTVPAANEVDVTGLLKVLGDLNVTGTADISGLTTVSGTSGIRSSNYVAGSAGWKFDGTSLEANTGVIGNGALANPVATSSMTGAATGFAVAMASTKITQASFTVPAGFTKALVFCHVEAGAYNSGTGGDYLNIQGAVNGVTGGSSQLYAATTEFAAGSAVRMSQLTGLTAGGTITAEAWLGTLVGPWNASGSNYAWVNSFCFWTR